MPQKSLDSKTIGQIQALRKNGLTQSQISKELSIGTGTVSKYAQGILPDVVPSGGVTKQAQAALRDANETIERLERAVGLTSKLSAAQLQPPVWSRPKQSKPDDAVATAFLSDLHLDEVVNPAEVRGVNAYNRTIAEERLKKFFNSTLQLTFDHMKGVAVKGLVLPMGGDMFSGNIHEELRQTNESTILESMLYWSERLTAGVRLLAQEFDDIHIPCVVGNHGRMSMKPIAKNRARDNFDWMLYHLIARETRDLKNITWDISEAADTMFEIYGTRYLLTHGDQFRGGGGIAGLLSPLMIGAHRKSKRQLAVGEPYDYMIIGHWHQYAQFKNILVNGSLKGYDEYAFINNFDFEPPQQAYWLTQPQHGMTIRGPLHILGSGEKYRNG